MKEARPKELELRWGILRADHDLTGKRENEEHVDANLIDTTVERVIGAGRTRKSGHYV